MGRKHNQKHKYERLLRFSESFNKLEGHPKFGPFIKSFKLSEKIQDIELPEAALLPQTPNEYCWVVEKITDVHCVQVDDKNMLFFPEVVFEDTWLTQDDILAIDPVYENHVGYPKSKKQFEKCIQILGPKKLIGYEEEEDGEGNDGKDQ